MAGKKVLIKTAVAVGVLGVVGFFLTRSMRDSRAVPYTIEREHLRNWTLVWQAAEGPTEPVLLLRPPPPLVGRLFDQVFKRAMESMRHPAMSALPLLLQGEFERFFAGRVTPEALVAAARDAGLDSVAIQPRCLGYRRVSDPRGAKQLYFVLFDMPAFGAFRERIAAALGGTAAFDPAALSPVLFVALAESDQDRWLPLRANPETDCLAPIVTS